MLTRGPFRTREHPLEAGRNCSSSHVPQSSQASPPQRKSSFHEPLFLAKKKKKSVHCSQGNNEVAHASSSEQSLSKGCSQPADILSWGKIHIVCKEAEEKWEWKATLTGCTKRRYLKGSTGAASSFKWHQGISYLLPFPDRAPLCSWSWPQTQTLPPHYRDYRHAPTTRHWLLLN